MLHPLIKNIFLVWVLKIKFPNVSTVGTHTSLPYASHCVGCWIRGYYKRMRIDNIEEFLIVSLDRDSKSDSDSDSSRLNNTPLLLHVQSEPAETSPLQNVRWYIMSSHSHTPLSTNLCIYLDSRREETSVLNGVQVIYIYTLISYL